MVAVETFKIYNTGVTLYSSFTFTTSMGDTKSFDIPPNSSQYFYVSTTYPVTSPSIDIIVIALGYLGSNFFNFSSTTSSDTFDFYGVGTIFSALTIGDTTYFEKIISDSSAPETTVLNTCFKLISSGSSVYDYYSTLGWNGNPCPPCSSTYCLSNTGYPTFNNLYFSAGTYNSQLYWSGETNGLFIYYNTGSTQWCLSTVLNGTCLLSGQSPCFNSCPDLDDVYFSIGACPTPTPTPTLNCANLNFSAIFDCEFETTPTPTITSTTTLTPTPTPTPTKFCNVVISATIQSVTSTPTPTPTFTPTPSAQIARTCTFEGAVTFNTIDDSIVCPYSYQFQSCYDGTMYYTTNQLVTPGNIPIENFQVYQANVNGTVMCVGYIGVNNNTIGIDNITLLIGPYGSQIGADCILCSESIIPTPTPTPTPTQSGIPSQCIDCGLEGYLYNKT